jgi:hypothetical protein
MNKMMCTKLGLFCVLLFRVALFVGVAIIYEYITFSCVAVQFRMLNLHVTAKESIVLVGNESFLLPSAMSQ